MKNNISIKSQARIRLLGLVLAASAALGICGCGTSEYEQRVEKGASFVRVSVAFEGVSGEAYDFPGTPLKLRLPTYVDGGAKAYTEESAEPSGEGKVNPNRVQPPFVKLPGLRVCYEMEGFDTDLNAPTPYYCYLAALPADQMAPDGKPVEDSILAQVKASLSGSDPVWETIMCPTPDGAPVVWKRIVMVCGQVFVDKKGEPRNMPGKFELYTREVDGWRVLIAFRGTQKLNADVFKMAPGVAGTVKIPPAA